MLCVSIQVYEHLGNGFQSYMSKQLFGKINCNLFKNKAIVINCILWPILAHKVDVSVELYI
jgi:hypothetical protein